MFLLASSSEAYPSLSGHWVSKDTGPFDCHIMSGYLQLCAGVCTKEGHRQVATGSEHCSTHVWSQESTNTSVVFHICCVMICLGWRLYSGCSTSLPWLFCIELQGSSPTAGCLSPKFPAANISVRPAVANEIFCGSVAAHLALRLSQTGCSDGFKLIAGFVAWSGSQVWTSHRRDLKTHLFTGH